MNAARAIAIACLVCALFASSRAAAVDPDTACLDCHAAGRREGQAPAIAGQQRAYLATQLQRFQARHRDSFPMSALVASLDARTIRALAHDLSARPWIPSRTKPRPEQIEQGRKAAARRDCGGCHGARFLGADIVPRLAGQHPVYLARQIAAFVEADRYHPPTGTGAPVRGISRAEADDLAAYLGSLDGD